MAKTREKTAFRGFLDSLEAGNVLLPHLEAELMINGKRAWPEEFSVRIHNKESEVDGWFHPSRHAAMPPLLLYYETHPDIYPALEHQRRITQDVMALMMGSALHSVIESMLIELEIADEANVETSFRSKQRRCTGALDVRELKLPGFEVGPMLEIKSAAWLPPRPRPEHILQMQPYLDLGAAFPDWGVLLYIEKPFPHRFREFKVERDQKLLDAIYAKWRDVREAVSLSDPSHLPNCPGCEYGNAVHVNCSARNVCRIGPPPLLAGTGGGGSK